MSLEEYEVEPCDCEPHVRCEHRNYYVDPDTAVQLVHSGWVEGGCNLMLFGTHGNWLAGIKECEPNCYDAPDDYDHSWCFADDSHSAMASMYTSDAVGIPIATKPGWKVREESTGPRYVTREVLVSRRVANGQARFRALLESTYGTADLRAAAERNLARFSEQQFLDGEGSDESRSEREQLRSPAPRVNGEYPF